MVKSKRGKLYILSLLSAAEVIIAYSVLGNISVGDAVVTFAIVPVLAAAMLLGPWGGAFLGLVYGVSGPDRPNGLQLAAIPSDPGGFRRGRD